MACQDDDSDFMSPTWPMKVSQGTDNGPAVLGFYIEKVFAWRSIYPVLFKYFRCVFGLGFAL